MKSFPLLLLAALLAVVFIPLGILTTLIRSIIRWKRVSFFAYLDESALGTALSIDTMGNTVCRDLLELTMTRNDPARYRFGTYTETISAVLGHNKALGTLSRLGRALANLLNFIDPGHVERAAGLPIPAPGILSVLIRVFLRDNGYQLAAVTGAALAFLLILLQ